jgi:4-hydroxyphenylpyruvate dioxygenase
MHDIERPRGTVASVVESARNNARIPRALNPNLLSVCLSAREIMNQPITSSANQLGLDGFSFVEFTAPDVSEMATQLFRLGFVPAALHPDQDVTLYRQGRINVVLNNRPSGRAVEFRRLHGASANGMAFRVEDPARAYELAVARGAVPADPAAGALGARGRAIEGIGGSLLYLVDANPFAEWREVHGWRAAAAENSVGLDLLDHLTHNLARGQMRRWSGFYERLFGFQEQKYFDIKGQATGLVSQAMIAPDGKIRIPLNESQDDESQIEEFIRSYQGEGIQHLAFSTNNIYETVEKLRARGVKLQHTSDAYYDLVPGRVSHHDEDLERLKRNRILIDGSEEEGILLQIFTENMFGPIFFEIIQRKGNTSFGHGNFQALFESIELDQIRRGVIGAPAGARRG